MTYETNLPFKEWQSKARLMPVKKGAAALDLDPSYFPEETTDLLVYPGDCYIECLDSGDYYLIIGNREWQGYSLAVIEQELYDGWYAVQ